MTLFLIISCALFFRFIWISWVLRRSGWSENWVWVVVFFSCIFFGGVLIFAFKSEFISQEVLSAFVVYGVVFYLGFDLSIIKKNLKLATRDP